jgi:GTP-binding protein
MGFVDEAEITIKSGDGGAGCVSFRRERFKPKGGPDGGDGGRGGDVLIKATNRLCSLYDFGSRRFFRAENGRSGRNGERSGRKGRDVTIQVPVGTEVKDKNTGELLADLLHHNQQTVLLKGGEGGKGNRRFATPTNRAPRFAQEGQKGKEKTLKLELKLIADVGIIGLPNAGKSTLLSRVSDAHPKISNYPFTTVAPNLGVVSLDEEHTITLADIPGLLQGASDGKGLGHRFLKHIERTKFILHVLDISHPKYGDIFKDFFTVIRELELFNPSLAMVDQTIVLNKIDLEPVSAQMSEQLCTAFHELGYECLAISALTGRGLDNLKQLLKEKVFLYSDRRKENEPLKDRHTPIC